MSDASRILSSLASGQTSASEELLPLVYSELRKLADARLRKTSKDDSIQATELVHEAFLRLVDSQQQQSWDSRGHFFAAAAEAMRRILIDRARKRLTAKHGGNHQRIALPDIPCDDPASATSLLSLDDALQQMQAEFPTHVQLVKLRYFAGLRLEDAAQAMGISRTTAARHWVFAKAWLLAEIEGSRQAGRG